MTIFLNDETKAEYKHDHLVLVQKDDWGPDVRVTLRYEDLNNTDFQSSGRCPVADDTAVKVDLSSVTILQADCLTSCTNRIYLTRGEWSRVLVEAYKRA